MYVSYIIIRIFFDTVSFVPKIQRAMMGSVCEGGIDCNMSSFQLEMRYLQKALCNKH